MAAFQNYQKEKFGLPGFARAITGRTVTVQVTAVAFVVNKADIYLFGRIFSALFGFFDGLFFCQIIQIDFCSL